MKIASLALSLSFGFTSLFSLGNLAFAQEASENETTRPVLRIYGPHDPMPALREVADRFEAKNNVKMELTSGPSENWKNFAVKDADVVVSGSEGMMEDFNKNLGIIDEKTVQTFYLRPTTLLVRAGNPKGIRGLKDVLKKDVKVMVVGSNGQTALWEDVVGRLKDTEMINTFRKRIVHSAADTSTGEKYWKEHEDVDVWLTMNSWGKEVPAGTETVEIEKNLTLYRSLAAAVTTTTTERELSLKFLKFLSSSQAERIFKANGWFRKESKESESTKLY